MLGYDTSSAARLARRRLTDGEFAEIVEREILPPWKEASETTRSLKEVRFKSPFPLERVQAYLALRQESWQILLDALKKGDAKLMEEFQRKFTAADDIAREFNPAQGRN